MAVNDQYLIPGLFPFSRLCGNPGYNISRIFLDKAQSQWGVAASSGPLSDFVIHFLECKQVIKLFSCSTELSMNIIMLINVEMPTTVGISTFISLINTTAESLEARKLFF